MVLSYFPEKLQAWLPPDLTEELILQGHEVTLFANVDFLPVIVEYILWSDKYLNHIAVEAKGFAAMLKKNKVAIIEDAKHKILGL